LRIIFYKLEGREETPLSPKNERKWECTISFASLKLEVCLTRKVKMRYSGA